MRVAVIILFLARFAHAADPESVAGQDHWAWKPLVAILPPDINEIRWADSPVDRFISARRETAGIEPAAVASREQMMRRISFDLIGLPPSPVEVDEYLQDASPDAWERVIDRLLASPHYGERWGRHWLDLARYADSNGYEFDEVRPDAWRYRDYVIDSFNSDKPYSRFIREQLAGDEIDPDEPAAMIATGFNLLGPDMTDSSDQVQRRQNTLNDMTDTAGSVFLGLTIGCARCHDHKFEPISMVDYYGLQAFFTHAKFHSNLNIVPVSQRAALAEAIGRFESERNVVQSELDELERPARSRLREAKLALQSEEVRAAHETPEEKRTPAERERVAETIRFVSVSTAEVVKELNAEEKSRHKFLMDQLKVIDQRKPKLDLAIGLQNAAQPEKTFVLEMGDPAHRGEEVQPGFLAVLTPGSASKNSAERIQDRGPYRVSSGRARLADWLVDEQHPLTSRVMVNRLWHHHFGRGLVRTPSDFGIQGAAPTHPELLDWLSVEFVRGGGSVKQIHRKMLTTATYRQSTAVTPVALKMDSENQLMSRMNRRRLEAEIVRDSLLAVSGRLNSKQGGPGVTIPVSSGDKGARAAAVTSDRGEYARRSVYLVVRRNLRNPFLEVFDLPDSNLSCSQREYSTTAPQALSLLNDADVVDAARTLAERLQGMDDPVSMSYRIVLGRSPSKAEHDLASDFLRESPLTEFCRALMNVNEFVYVD